MTVYVVSDGTGGQIDSVWTTSEAAIARAAKLNAGAQETLAWGVTAATLDAP